ncbi:MAG: hypothetical protein JO251_07880 [Verrucomicrobia bacterium]|nr:hypothetical protein [Verrucomicrobiota bacterium]
MELVLKASHSRVEHRPVDLTAFVSTKGKRLINYTTADVGGVADAFRLGDTNRLSKSGNADSHVVGKDRYVHVIFPSAQG